MEEQKDNQVMVLKSLTYGFRLKNHNVDQEKLQIIKKRERTALKILKGG
jgi:hypothetical protein